jgi:hypothetical protein
MKSGLITRKEYFSNMKVNGVASLAGIAGASAGAAIGFLVGTTI